MEDITSGNYNTGVASLSNVTSGLRNTGIGAFNLTNLTSGCDNTSLGAYGSCALTTGCYNTHAGWASFNKATTAKFNTGVGQRSQCCITTACYNTSMGTSALGTIATTNHSTAFGRSVLQSATCSKNTAAGEYAGCSVTTGTDNTLMGYKAGISITTGIGNTVLGDLSLSSTTTAGCSTAIGNSAIRGPSTGGKNVGLGVAAGENAATGTTDLVAIGFRSMFYTSNGAAKTTSIGCRNNIYPTRCCVTTIGTYTGAPAICETRWQGSTCNCVYEDWFEVSDQRDKANIKDLNPKLGLEFIKKLKPVSFNWDQREEYVRECGFEFGQKDGTLMVNHKEYGFIAQDIKQVLSELGLRWDALKGKEETKYTLQHSALNASVTKAIQQLLEKVEYLESKTLILESK
jgi:hypothetical protein